MKDEPSIERLQEISQKHPDQEIRTMALMLLVRLSVELGDSAIWSKVSPGWKGTKNDN